MPYRDQTDALQQKVESLSADLASRDEELSALRRELSELQRRHARAMAVLRMIADQKKLRTALDELRLDEGMRHAESIVPPKDSTGSKESEEEDPFPPSSPGSYLQLDGDT
ncbi:MAG: hypothetical protein AAGF12_29440 [Myxococcota bacterium]